MSRLYIGGVVLSFILALTMRLFIYFMPVIALAMLASNYSIRHGWSDETQMEAAPQATIIVQEIWKSTNISVKKPDVSLPQTNVLVSALEE